jgi:hypothetical protein
METQMLKRIGPGAELRRLNEERDHVTLQISLAWDKVSPDMGALEALHYKLKNLEYRIATHPPGEEA